MISRVRRYKKKEPSRDAHKIYVVCEGSSDEPRYFGFFAGLSSNLNVIPIPSEIGMTDPTQLIKQAQKLFDKETGRYTLDNTQGDRVWFVVDTDTWEKDGKIAKLRSFCHDKNMEVRTGSNKYKSYDVWNVAQSNPCFEIWLYYHIYDKAPRQEDVKESVSFKQYVGSKILGGFDYDSDPMKLKDAILNAETNFGKDNQGILIPFATEVFLLGKEIHSFVSEELVKLNNRML